MRYFVAPDEDRRLDAESRRHLRGSFVELSDGVTQYELTGPAQGALVLMFGGLTVPLSYWDGLVPQLHRRGFRTLAYSCYGRGYCDRVRVRYDETLFVRQVAELTARLGVRERMHLVGSSMGALIGMTYAGQYPENVATLTLIGPAGLGRQVLSPDRLLRNDVVAGVVAKRLGRRILERHLGHNVRDPARAAELAAIVGDAHRCEGSLHALFDTLQHVRLSGRTDLYRRTAALGIPTLLLWGAEDRVTPVGPHLERACALLDPVHCHVVDGCGHMVPFERPVDVADQVASFVGRRVERRQA